MNIKWLEEEEEEEKYDYYYNNNLYYLYYAHTHTFTYRQYERSFIIFLYSNFWYVQAGLFSVHPLSSLWLFSRRKVFAQFYFNI